MMLDTIKAHYQSKLDAYGHTPQGVDWRDEVAQLDRLQALCLLFGRDEGYTLNDWGCGYGRLATMTKHSRYFGYDIVPQELEAGEFILSDKPTKMADYTVASGLFNVMSGERDEWWEHIQRCFVTMDAMSRKGYAFNMLHARADRKQEGLFYASPEWCLTWIPSGYQRISILQYYSPWDFTIMVQK